MGARYALVYDPDVWRQVRLIGQKHYGLLRRAIDARLAHEPELETRNRKPLTRPSTLGAS